MWFEGFTLAHLPISLLVMAALWVSKILVLCLLCGVSIACFSCAIINMRKAGQLHRLRPRHWKNEFVLAKSYMTQDLPALLKSWAF